MEAPIVVMHQGIHVVRDDLFAGGTKARFITALFDGIEEMVYASPAEGGAQTAIATCAKALGKRATIFVAKRKEPHPRSLMAKALGAKILQVAPGYLGVVQKRAADYAKARGAWLAPFGIDTPEACAAIAQAARLTGIEPDEIWCAAGSGVLARGLAMAWPQAALHAVQIGRALTPDEAGRAIMHKHPLAFGDRCRIMPPFPSDAHYDAKAWEICINLKRGKTVLFWNVTADAAA